MTLEQHLRAVATAALELADDLRRDAFYEEPATQAYDIECGCKELVSYIAAFREEDAERAADAAGVADQYAEFRHRTHEIV